MRQTGRALTALLASLVLLGSSARESCPMGGSSLISPGRQREDAYRTASSNAELVAPAAAAAPSRRRGVQQSGEAAVAVNFIDADLFAAQKQAGVAVTTLAADEEFLRRVTLDLTGQIPDTATVVAFLADRAPDKRAKKIDELLASDGFADRWTMWFGDLVQNVTVANNSREYYLGRNAYHAWIRQSFLAGKPYDQTVRELIAGKGDSFVEGTPNYIVRQLQSNGPAQDTYDNLAAHTGERFLGMPLLCLSCHSGLGHLELVNQYLRAKQRSDFWAMAAFFSRTRAPGTRYIDPNNPNANPIKFTVSDNTTGQYLLNTNSGNKTPRAAAAGASNSVPPAYMFTGGTPGTGENWRDAYGRMLAADRQFARAAVNYVWKEMFGIGIVEPVNAFDLARLDPNKLPAGQTLQPTNAKLLEDLTDAFINGKFDLRGLLRTIALSSSYQLASRYTPGGWSESWTTLFARHYPHRLPAEMVLDAVTRATNVPATLNAQGMTGLTRAMQLPDTTEPGSRSQFGMFLNEFGRGDRDDTPRTNDTSISQALSLLNNTLVTTRVRRATVNSTVAKVLAGTSDTASIADQLYLATLSRHPSAAELAAARGYLAGGTLATRAEDLQFALMNQLEFLFD